MPDSGPHDILAFVAHEPDRLVPGTVLVADELLRPGLPAISCPAAAKTAPPLNSKPLRSKLIKIRSLRAHAHRQPRSTPTSSGKFFHR